MVNKRRCTQDGLVLGDSMEINQIIDEYGKKVYNLAFRITGNRQDAEDAAQETFMQVYQKLESFRGDSSVYTWIYKITLNICLNMKKKIDKTYAESLNGKAEMFKDDIPPEVREWYHHPEKALYIKELLEEIRHGCLHFLSFRLPENQRIIYVLRNILDFSYKEISEITGLGENVIKARLNRARVNLMDYFSGRCQWLCDESTCKCDTRIGFALALDPEILKRVKEQAIEAGIASASEMNEVYKPHIDDLYRKFPTLEYWGKDILKEKIG